MIKLDMEMVPAAGHIIFGYPGLLKEAIALRRFVLNRQTYAGDRGVYSNGAEGF